MGGRGGVAYAAQQTRMLSYKEPLLNRDSNFRSCICSFICFEGQAL